MYVCIYNILYIYIYIYICQNLFFPVCSFGCKQISARWGINFVDLMQSLQSGALWSVRLSSCNISWHKRRPLPDDLEQVPLRNTVLIFLIMLRMEVFVFFALCFTCVDDYLQVPLRMLVASVFGFKLGASSFHLLQTRRAAKRCEIMPNGPKPACLPLRQSTAAGAPGRPICPGAWTPVGVD